MSPLEAAADRMVSLAEVRSDQWREELALNDRGKPDGTASNIATALELAPELKGIVGFDEFEQRAMLMRAPPWQRGRYERRPWSDADDTELLLFLQTNGVPVRAITTVTDTVRMVARRHGFDPLADYLKSLNWDGSPRLEAWLTTYLDAEPTKLNRAIARAFLISAVARGLDPGCQADHVLCLESPQGKGKTETVRTLGGEWTQENLPDMHSKDGIAALSGAWFVELSELAAMGRSEVEAVKSFISRRVDRYRPAYGRHVVEQPRRCVFIATTNEGQYLRDRTGNRRFWPVKCGTVDLEALREDRNQIFAEAVTAYKAGEAWHFTNPEIIQAAQVEQMARVEHDPWLADIANHLQGKTSTTTGQLLDALGIERGRSSAPQAKRIAGIMRELGFDCTEDQSQRRTGGTREVIWTINHEDSKP